MPVDEKITLAQLERARAQLERAHERFEGGDSRGLLEAVGICLHWKDIAPPKWLLVEWNAALIKWETADVRELGDAFQVHRPKYWSQKRARKDHYWDIMWQRVVRLNRDDPKNNRIDRALFDTVADELNAKYELGLNGTDVSDAYYGHRVTPRA